MFSKIILTNRKLCYKIQKYLPQAKINFSEKYVQLVTRYMNSKSNQIIVDVGSGKSCSYAKNKNMELNTKIIAVDISMDELIFNNDVDEKIVSDALDNLPFKNEEIDIVTSKSFLEHLENIEDFILQSRRVIKRGGLFIHLFPCRYAPFAIINQMLPNKIAKKLLYCIIPESKGISGFPAYYDRCYNSSITRLLEKYDFEIIESYFSYYQSPYFNFLLPLFLLSVIYEYLLLKTNAKNLSAYMIIVARKKVNISD
ncbi:class I SAM-dependent methyltransferase [Pelotomaculum propionicicum]|uniref:class I SAM-dependent methyltransferase n=1 Tax=Pelotomaculum propionicicum TaxID=258475 RepID=UPI003B80FDC3